MREIVIDTETTGLDPTDGDRIVEIGAVELEEMIGRAPCNSQSPGARSSPLPRSRLRCQ
jgi:hypothetical protein